MPAIHIVERYNAIQYTGSNSAEIDALVTHLDIISETGGVLTVESPTGTSITPINTNDWVRYNQGVVVSVHNTSTFDNYYVQNAVFGDLAAVSGVLATGVKECGTLSPGNTTVSVDLVTSMPDTNYTPNAQIFAAAGILGTVSITSVSVNDADTIDVVVNNSGVLGLTGARILVTATA